MKLSVTKNTKPSLTVGLIGPSKTGKSTLFDKLYQENIPIRPRKTIKILKKKQKQFELEMFSREIDDICLTVIDFPGNLKYLPTTIPTLGRVNVAILVVSAKPGEFEAGFLKSQTTKEYSILVKALGIEQLVVVINKFDTVDDCLIKYRFDYIKTILNHFLTNKCRFPKDSINWSIDGTMSLTNDKKYKDLPLIPHFDTKSLLKIFKIKCLTRMTHEGNLRFLILENFKEEKKIIISGKIIDGHIQTGMKCMLFPNKKNKKKLRSKKF